MKILNYWSQKSYNLTSLYCFLWKVRSTTTIHNQFLISNGEIIFVICEIKPQFCQNVKPKGGHLWSFNRYSFVRYCFLYIIVIADIWIINKHCHQSKLFAVLEILKNYRIRKTLSKLRASVVDFLILQQKFSLVNWNFQRRINLLCNLWFCEIIFIAWRR